jgi:hypothetical protein
MCHPLTNKWVCRVPPPQSLPWRSWQSHQWAHENSTNLYKKLAIETEEQGCYKRIS